MQLHCGSRVLDLSQVHVMGILNVTPDSFFDGGSYFSGARLNIDLALKRAEEMVQAGATIVDIGGESTRPGAQMISVQQEIERVLPIVEAIAERLDVVISVDTSSPDLIAQAAAAGAGLINDVRALEKEGAVGAAAASGLPVCLMHMQGQPGSMQHAPNYSDVVREVKSYLLQRVAVCQSAGIPSRNLLIDPGFGFGKTDTHNLALIESLPEFSETGYPVLVGLSRKSMIGRLLGREVNQRLAGSLALAMIALQKGAKIIRVHDVAETVDTVKIFEKIGKR